MDVAWGPVSIRRLPIPIGADRHFVFDNAGTSDGKYLIGISQPNAFPNTQDPSYAVLYDVANGALQQMAELVSPKSQILWAGADDRWVVWSEAPDQPYFYDWRLRSFDRRTGRVREIARATVAGGRPVQGPYPEPFVSHGILVWGQAVGDGLGPGRMRNAVVREVDLSTDVATTVATSAGAPVISGPWVAWEVATGSLAGYVQLSNRETTQTIRIDQAPPTFVLDRSSAAFNDPEALSISLIDDITSSVAPRVIARGDDVADHLEWVTLNARVVAWAQSNATRVYDRAEKRLVALPLVQGRSGVTICGPLIVWEEIALGTSPYRGWSDSILIVDSSTLPVRP